MQNILVSTPGPQTGPPGLSAVRSPSKAKQTLSRPRTRMGRDESGTLAALKVLRQEVVDPAIATHGGRIVKTCASRKPYPHVSGQADRIVSAG
jgi:hypothetical protein